MKNLKPYTDYEFGLFAYVDKRNGEMMKLTKIAGQKFRTLNYFDTISYSGYSTYISVSIKGLIEGAKIDALTLYDSSWNVIKQMDEITFDPRKCDIYARNRRFIKWRKSYNRLF